MFVCQIHYSATLTKFKTARMATKVGRTQSELQKRKRASRCGCRWLASMLSVVMLGKRLLLLRIYYQQRRNLWRGICLAVEPVMSSYSTPPTHRSNMSNAFKLTPRDPVPEVDSTPIPETEPEPSPEFDTTPPQEEVRPATPPEINPNPGPEIDPVPSVKPQIDPAL